MNRYRFPTSKLFACDIEINLDIGTFDIEGCWTQRMQLRMHVRRSTRSAHQLDRAAHFIANIFRLRPVIISVFCSAIKLSTPATTCLTVAVDDAKQVVSWRGTGPVFSSCPRVQSRRLTRIHSLTVTHTFKIKSNLNLKFESLLVVQLVTVQVLFAPA
jgi:hypothetical protein